MRRQGFEFKQLLITLTHRATRTRERVCKEDGGTIRREHASSREAERTSHPGPLLVLGEGEVEARCGAPATWPPGHPLLLWSTLRPLHLTTRQTKDWDVLTASTRNTTGPPYPWIPFFSLLGPGERILRFLPQWLQVHLNFSDRK